MKTKIISALISFLLVLPVAAKSVQERDIEQENKNIELVVQFYDEFFNQHNTDIAQQYIIPDYKQHNPYVPDGLEPFVGFFVEQFKQNPESSAIIHRYAAHGDLVYLHVHSTISKDDRGEAVVDIFRVVDNMITEHWDVIQPVPAEKANDNTMF